MDGRKLEVKGVRRTQRTDDPNAKYSPDGRWIAYDSNESGKREVFVQTFPASGGKWPVSTKGGFDPRWRRDGKELFYLSSDGKMMTVEVKAGGTFEPGIPRVLFDLSALRLVFAGGYSITADGQRFLFVSQMAETARACGVGPDAEDLALSLRQPDGRDCPFVVGGCSQLDGGGQEVTIAAGTGVRM